MLSSGFINASISRAVLVGIIGTSIAASITDTKYYFFINVFPHLWKYGQFWRLLIWQTCCTNSTELLFASMTIYNMRIIERLWGSSKFASFLIVLYPLTSLLTPTLLALVLRPASFNAINYLPAGPTPLIFALLAQYYAAIPHTYKYRLVTSSPAQGAPTPEGIVFSDKTMTYLLAGQLALSQFPGSLLSAAVGWVCGLAWRGELFPEAVVRWRVPGWLVGGSARRDAGFDGLRRRLEGEGRASGVDAVQGESGEGLLRRGGAG